MLYNLVTLVCVWYIYICIYIIARMYTTFWMGHLTHTHTQPLFHTPLLLCYYLRSYVLPDIPSLND